MSKPYYRNNLTGNYGVLEEKVISISGLGLSSYLRLRIVRAVNGVIELSSKLENVTSKDLVEVSPNEVREALLDF